MLKRQLTRIADAIEQNTNKNRMGHGEHACQFCDARGMTNVEHSDACPLGQLWLLINNMPNSSGTLSETMEAMGCAVHL